jgi:hypothetical protein
MYPLDLETSISEEPKTIKNEEELEAALEEILGSEENQRVIAALRAQATA